MLLEFCIAKLHVASNKHVSPSYAIFFLNENVISCTLQAHSLSLYDTPQGTFFALAPKIITSNALSRSAFHIACWDPDTGTFFYGNAISVWKKRERSPSRRLLPRRHVSLSSDTPAVWQPSSLLLHPGEQKTPRLHAAAYTSFHPAFDSYVLFSIKTAETVEPFLNTTLLNEVLFYRNHVHVHLIHCSM